MLCRNVSIRIVPIKKRTRFSASSSQSLCCVISAVPGGTNQAKPKGGLDLLGDLGGDPFASPTSNTAAGEQLGGMTLFLRDMNTQRHVTNFQSLGLLVEVHKSPCCVEILVTVHFVVFSTGRRLRRLLKFRRRRRRSATAAKCSLPSVTIRLVFFGNVCACLTPSSKNSPRKPPMCLSVNTFSVGVSLAKTHFGTSSVRANTP